MVLPTMFRDTQNRYEPNLPFAQSLSPTMFRDNQNPNEPNLPFSQKRQTYYDYIVNGDHWTFGKMVDKSVRWTESNAQQYRNKGYSVVKVGDTGGILKPKPPITNGGGTTTTGSGYSKSYIDEHIDRLYRIHEEQEGRITDAYDHRTSIEGKVETGIAARDKIHNTLSDLGRSVSDVSSALSVHSTHDLIPNPLGDLEKYLPYVLIGGVAILAMSGRKSRK
jgi:hypothetical protein